MEQEQVKSTGCCPPFNPEPWDGKEHAWQDKRFVKDHTTSFMHMPLNMGSVMKRMMEKIQAADAAEMENYLILTRDLSPWKAEQLVYVTKEVPEMENVKLSGTYLSKVYEGPFKEAKNWCTDMQQYVEGKGKSVKNLYFFYTTCPKCIKAYGKNYVVAFAQV